MSTGPRLPWKFESYDSSIVVYFTDREVEWDTSHPTQQSLASIPGTAYALDQRRRSPSLVDVRRDTIRHLVDESCGDDIDEYIRTTRAKARRIGQGRLWSTHPNGDHWTVARLVDVPEFDLGKLGELPIPAIWTFDGLTDWYGKNPITNQGVTGVTTTTRDITVVNPGDLPQPLMVMRWRANTSGGIVAPSVQNLTNGYSIGSLRNSASVNSEIRIDTNDLSMRYSNDNGSTYTNDYANRVIGNNQALWMVLDPGTNTLRLSSGGTPNYDFELSFYAAYDR